jgi:hypothetical protein
MLLLEHLKVNALSDLKLRWATRTVNVSCVLRPFVKFVPLASTLTVS